ncbi:MAG: hypothetical protein MUP25_00555, partial [Syntrophales bacterium]|nr:hypothetical protein [Syntrophales bacterium]
GVPDSHLAIISLISGNRLDLPYAVLNFAISLICPIFSLGGAILPELHSLGREGLKNLYREKLQIPLNPPFPKGDFNTPLF